MKDLLLFRHAKAKPALPGQDDRERRLTGRGRGAALAMARWMRDAGWSPGLVLFSTATRTRQTAAIALMVLPAARLVAEDGLYLAEMQALRARVGAIDPEVDAAMIVGHNPGLEDLARSMLPARPRAESAAALGMATGAVAWFRSPATDWRHFLAAGPSLVAAMSPDRLADEAAR
ncbi:MAG: SixA phosphatase family protein [Alphaproteobacteria bacterium]